MENIRPYLHASAHYGKTWDFLTQSVLWLHCVYVHLTLYFSYVPLSHTSVLHKTEVWLSGTYEKYRVKCMYIPLHEALHDLLAYPHMQLDTPTPTTSRPTVDVPG
eukprot:scaffold40890_cov62-Attheya_sp.AAC.11